MKQFIPYIRRFLGDSELAFGELILVISALFLGGMQVFATENQAVSPSAGNIKLDFSSSSNPVVSEEVNPTIKPVASRYEISQRAEVAKKQREERESRAVIARTAAGRTEGVSGEEKRALAKQTADKYGIDWKILEAVWQVETGKSWDTSKSSYAGATGPMQFMPATFRAYAQDGNGDGKAEIGKAEDAVASAAHLLAQNGLSQGNVDKALYNYNHSMAYVAKVKRVANSIVD